MVERKEARERSQRVLRSSVTPFAVTFPVSASYLSLFAPKAMPEFDHASFCLRPFRVPRPRTTAAASRPENRGLPSLFARFPLNFLVLSSSNFLQVLVVHAIINALDMLTLKSAAALRADVRYRFVGVCGLVVDLDPRGVHTGFVLSFIFSTRQCMIAWHTSKAS